MKVIEYGVYGLLGVFILALVYLTIRPLQVTTTPVTLTIDEGKIVRKN